MISLVYINTKSEPWVCGLAGLVMDSRHPCRNQDRNGWQSSRYKRIDKIVGVARAPHRLVGPWGYTGRRFTPATCTTRRPRPCQRQYGPHITQIRQWLNVWGSRLVPGYTLGCMIGRSGKHYRDYVRSGLHSSASICPSLCQVVSI